MNTRILFLVLISLFAVFAKAQENTDFLPTSTVKDELFTSPETTEKETPDPISEYKLTIPAPEEVTFNPYKSGLIDKTYGLNRNFSYMLYSNNDIVKGIGKSYNAGGMMIYHPTDKLTFSFGSSLMRYSNHMGSFNDAMLQGSMTYQFNDWLKLYLYGQYSFNSESNALSRGYYLSQQSCYGAMIMIKVIDKKKYSIDMNVGAERAYNPFNKEWEMNYSMAPSITLK